MCAPRLRWALPLFHAVIDVCLFGSLTWVQWDYLASVKRPPPMWYQNYEPLAPLDAELLRETPTPQPLKAIVLGTFPAALAASLILPNWQRSTPFDLRWAGIEMSLAGLFWHAVGLFAEKSRPSIRQALRIYVLLRLLSIPATMSFWTTWASGLQIVALLLAWCSAGVFLLVRLFRRPTATIPP